MKRKILTGFLALVLILQAFIPSFAYAIEEKPIDNKLTTKKVESSGGNLVTIGKLTKDNYPEIDPATLLRVAKEERNKLNGKKMGGGETLFSTNSPYIPGQQPGDSEKPKYVAKIEGEVKARGLDGGSFNWNQILGNQPIKLELRQLDKSKSSQPGNPIGETGLKLILEVTKAGEFKLTDPSGNPTYLPLFTSEGNPYEYQVQIDRKSYENVELILSTNAETPGSSFKPEGDLQVATIHFNIGIQQLASTKFVSQWHTGLAEGERPQIEGKFDMGGEDEYTYFDFPKNDTSQTIFREGYDENFTENEDKDFWLMPDSDLDRNPQTVEVKTDTDGLTFNTTDKTVTSGDHKFKYDFNYDVINGGKLTMTEVIPITFDANGGKFVSITDPNADQKIVKEVEYDKDLTEDVEKPKKDLETFKGWATTEKGKPLSEEDFKAAIKNIKEAKTFYAIWDNNDIVAEELEVKESFKDGETWVNDFIPKLETLKGQVKIKDASGTPQALEATDTFAIVDGTNEYKTDADAKDYLYGKLQEKDDGNKPSRTETVKAKITHANGTSQTVDIPIKVIKNIYEAKTLTEKPFYVPDGYVKVTVDPTTKAQDPQKTYYYVNPAAKVVIPGTDPTGTDGNVFTKWTMKADTATGDGADYNLSARHQFTEASTITAQYSKDVIPQEGDTKPEGVPDNFVKVTFVPTDNGTMEGAKIFWVNPAVEVTIPVNNPVGKTHYTFKEWKMGANADGAVYTPSTPTKFTDTNGTTITATYTESDNIIPYDPSVPDPMVRPEGYVRVTFAADPGLKLTESKAYYVKANAGITLKTIKDDATKGYPTYEEQTGYKFKEWDKEDSLVIEAADIVVTAKATTLDDVVPKDNPQGGENDKPAGYISVTFKTTDKAGSIEKVVYINPNKAVALEGQAPEVNPITGYEFADWDRPIKEKIQYKDNDVITAQFNKIGDVVPGDKAQPAGYIKVIFDKGEHGELSGTTSYWVKPEVEVTVEAPSVKANTGYKFTKWDKETTFTAKTTDTEIKITAEYEKLEDIIPSTDENEKPNTKPEGYVTVTFEKGEHGTLEGQNVYYVNPEADPVKTLADIAKPTVSPETGYKFKSWNFADTKEILSDITVIAQYDSIDDVVPKTKEDESDKPEGYIKVTFVKGDHGKELTGQAVYYVNPNKAVVLKDKAPTAVPNTGYKFADWDTQIAKKIQYSDGDKITALYNEIGDVIPQEKIDGSDKPAGYLTVTFLDGGHGTLTGKTVYYVKPDKEVTVPAPTVTPNVGWKQKDGEQAWDSKLTRTFTDENTTITAQYDPLENVIPGDQTKPDGYFTVTFKAENGSLAGTTTYYVKPGVEVNLSDKANALTKNPNVGYTAEGGTWEPTVEAKTYTKDETYTFKFKKLADIIPGDENTQRPKGYVKVEFRSDINGSLEGNTIFYVNPNANKTMKDITPLPTIKANKGYKVGSPNWHADFTNDTTEIKEDRIYVANYEALGEAKITYIPRDPEMGSVSLESEDLAEDKAIQGSTATAKPGYEFVKWINTKGDTVSDDAKFVPSEKQSATYIAVFKAKDPITFTVNKVWVDDVTPVPTMNFTLYRQVEGGAEEAVPGADVKEITKTNTEATWTNLPKEDSQGKPYTYSVKETFKDESADVKNANWILGEMVTDGEGNNTITNKLKTVPGTGDIPNENEHRMGKLTITKKIESKVIKKQITTFGAKAPAAPLTFTFKVTDPYGKEETFTLKAGESKELNNLLYGDYTVEETDAKGLTPFVKVGNGDETQSKTGKVTLTTTDKEGTVTFTNKNVKPEENPNIIEVKATKVWVDGPSKDHGAVDLKLYRQVGDQEKVEVTDVNAEVTRVVSGDPTFNYVWKNLPKINDKGEEYTYTVEEAGVTDGKVTVGDGEDARTYNVTVDEETKTITNTYVVPQTKDNVIGKKVWKDVPTETTPPTVKLELWRKTSANPDGEKAVEQPMALDANNQADFGKQDKTDNNGVEYTYFVKELDENGSAFNHSNYTSEVNGLTVTNTYHAPEVKYTVTYLPGSSTATGTMNPVTVAENTNYTVLANGFTNSGYTFKGWKVGDTTQIIQPGDTINVTGNVTLTAQWENTTTPPTPDPDKPNPWDPNPWNPDYPDLPYIPRYPEVRYETIVQEKIVKVPVPIADNAYVKEVRYMQGFMGDFRPKDGLTRAEAAQILANALVEDGYKYNANFKLPYKDIGEAWYTRAVKIVTEAKVFEGYDDGNFKPQDKITRNEWIATLKRFQELGDVSGNHMKLKDGHWAMAEIEAAYKEGWLKIYTDGLATYKGDEFIPREEVAAVSNKAFNRVLDKTYIINNDKSLITYKDVKKDMWSYEDILCASNTFLYKKDLYRAHWIKEDNNQFNINTDGFEIVKAKFQRNPR